MRSIINKMIVIPSVNASNFFLVKKGLAKVRKLGARWVHLDIADGKFTKIRLWNNPKELRVISHKLRVNLEAHLMVKNPDAVLGDWLKSGVKRLIVHLESAKDIKAMVQQCRKAKAELALAINPQTPVEKLLPYKNQIKQVLILAVAPGLAGQKFGQGQLKKIRSLRRLMPNVKIEVDGGINLETAKLCKKAGADILVSASYIFNNKNPKIAYQQLKKL